VGPATAKRSSNNDRICSVQTQRKQDKVQLVKDLRRTLCFICVWGVCWKLWSVRLRWPYY